MVGLRSRTRWMRVPFALLVFVFGVAPAEAHIPPPAYLNIGVYDDRVDTEVVIEFAIFRSWFGVDPATLQEDGTLSDEVRAKILAGLRQRLEIGVDGIDAALTAVSARPHVYQDHLQTWSFVHLLARVPATLPPDQVAFVWRGYSEDASYVFDDIDAELEAYGESYYPRFRKKEPEYIWHRPLEVARQPPPALPAAKKGRSASLPLLSVFLGLLGVFGAFALRSRSRAGASALVLTALTLGILVLGVTVDLPLPGEAPLERPTDEEAVAIFASLHRGMYTALQGVDESAVYDELDRCVTQELLPELYLDVQRSLIMEQEGGAIARIQKTEIDEVEVLPDGDGTAPWFRVHARWRVEGKVGHWGHTHQRINGYEANVTVLARDGHWKISTIDVLDETRMDDGRERRVR